MKKITLLFYLLIGSSFLFAQTEISGVTPEKTITIGGETLKYNGAGLREKYFLDLYVGTLYLTERSKDAKQLIAADETMAITLDIVSGLIGSDKMKEAVEEGFKKSTKGNTHPLKDKINAFQMSFNDPIVKGDHFVIGYVKGKGTEVHKNGKKIKTIEGLEFKKALFGIWLCDDPADEDLKAGMLGLD